MTDTEKDNIRAKVHAEGARLHDILAPFYLGRVCPIQQGFPECRGTHCVAFLPQVENGKITGAHCAIPLVAAQAGPIAAGMEALAMQVAQASGASPKIIEPPSGLVR